MSKIAVRFTDEFTDLIEILTELEKRLPQLKDNKLYLASIPTYLSSGAYKFFVAQPEGKPNSLEQATAFGFLAFYRAPMQERVVLAVEAVWFADDQLDAQLAIWRVIAALAKQMDFHGICVNERSVNTPQALKDLLARGNLDGDPVAEEQSVLQANVGGMYSAFADGALGTSAFFADCIRIFTLRVPVDLSGVSVKMT